MTITDKFHELYVFCPKCGSKLEHLDHKATCGTCHHDWYNNPAVSTSIALIKDHKILLAKRAIEPEKGKWDIPGGFIEPGETAEEGIIREMLEETGLSVKIDEYLGSVADIYADRPSLPLLYKVSLNQKAEPMAQDDVAELRWFGIDELPSELAFKNVDVIIEKIKKYL